MTEPTTPADTLRSLLTHGQATHPVTNHADTHQPDGTGTPCWRVKIAGATSDPLPMDASQHQIEQAILQAVSRASARHT